MKRCARCQRELPLEVFTRRRGDSHGGSYCKDCRREYSQAHYRQNRERYVERILQYRRREQERLRRIKDVPCADCGVKYPHYVMDFDHREGTVKRGNLSHLVADGYLCGPSLDAEVAKCDVVCAN